jgi:hypothetical protein
MNHYSDTTYNFLFFVINILSKIKRIKIHFNIIKTNFCLNVFQFILKIKKIEIFSIFFLNN